MICLSLKIKDYDQNVTHEVSCIGDTEADARANGMNKVRKMVGSNRLEITDVKRKGVFAL